MRRFSSIVGVIGGLPLVVLIALPLAALLFSVTPGELLAQLRSPETSLAVRVSATTVCASVTFVVVSGTLLCLGVRKSGPLGRIVETLTTLPAVLPPSAAGIALLLAFGRNGLLGHYLESAGIRVAFTPLAVVMSQAFVATPFFVRETLTGLRTLDTEVLEAASLDGAGSLQRFLFVSFPMVRPFFLGGAVLAAARATGEFGATILFAGNLQGVTQTMPLAIYLGFQSNLTEAKALATLLLLFAIGVVLIAHSLGSLKALRAQS